MTATQVNWKRARRIRQAVQVLFFALFIYLLFARIDQRQAPALADLFFRLNPLSALAAGLSSRGWIQGLEWALITLGVTLIVGRVWCGWVCPLGTLLEWTAFRRGRLRHTALAPLRVWKYVLLALILTMALMGSLTLLALDPIAILTRTMTTSILPALHYGITSIEAALYPVRFLRPAVDAFEKLVRGSVLPFNQPAFSQNVLIGLLFAGLLALNALADRFWCRYLCPLGALLGLLSRLSLFQPVVGSACNGCSRCARVCRPGAVEIGGQRAKILPSECTVCLDCLVECRQDEIKIKPVLRPAPAADPARPVGISRREALYTFGAGLAGFLLLRSDLRARRKDPFLIRPPGVEDENTFLSACLRCSQCMRICPSTALQPASYQAGLEGLWSPVLVARVGSCDYGCHACGQVCPTGAIPNMTLEEKRSAVIGKASLNQGRCLPWASGQPCIVCEEMCPTPQKSIRLEEIHLRDEEGGEIVLQRPHVVRELCIGCGICENRCPLEGEAGIRVYGI